MAGGWIETRLGDVTDLLTGYPFKSQHYTDDATAPKLLGGDNIVQGNLRWENVRRWPRTLTDGLDDYWLEPGDVVLAMDRPWIDAGLKRAAISKDDVPSLLIQRTARLRGTSDLDTAFLRYVISSTAFTQYVLSVQTGTVVPHISPTQIRAYSFLLPPIEEQRFIASILGALDDKIELNRRMNVTLEAMAQALFKEWFVDGAKEEWEEKSLTTLFTISKTSVNPGASPEEVFDHYSIPAFDDGRLPKQELGDTIKSNKFIVPEDCILMSKLNPRFPRVWLPLLDGQRQAITSTEFIVCVPKFDELREFIYGLFTSHLFASEFNNMATGSTGSHQRVRPESMLKMETVMPGRSAIKAYSTMVRPMLERINANTNESRTLAALRDTLLPRLMRGEVRVKGRAGSISEH